MDPASCLFEKGRGQAADSRGNYNNNTIYVGGCQEGAVVLLDKPGDTPGMLNRLQKHSPFYTTSGERYRDFKEAACTAEDYAKLTGSSCPSMYHREPLCTPLICQRLHVPSTVKGQVDHTISRRCAAEYAPAARILCSTLRHGSRRGVKARRSRLRLLRTTRTT